MALHDVTWCMVVWWTLNAPRWQQFHVAPANASAVSTPLRWIFKDVHKKLVTRVESHPGAASLLESGEWRYVKAIKNNNKNNNYYS